MTIYFPLIIDDQLNSFVAVRKKNAVNIRIRKKEKQPERREKNNLKFYHQESEWRSRDRRRCTQSNLFLA